MKRNKILKLIILVSLFINITMSYGFNIFPEKVDVPPPQFDSSNTMDPTSEKLSAHIYIDSTLSMQGFVIPNTSTNYSKTIENLESSFTTAWKHIKDVRFYQFGAKIIPLEGFLRARDQRFYMTPNINTTTHIEDIITASTTCNNNNLVSIVTDLYQTDANVSQLVRLIQQRCINNNYAVGVIGIKSQYDGTVYDVGVDALSFPYNSGNNPDRFRPFYMILLGKHADITNYYERLKLSLPFLSDSSFSSFVIFSRYINSPLAYFRKDSFKENPGLVADPIIPSHLKNNDVIPYVKEFTRRNDPNAKFVTNLAFEKLPYTVNFNPDLIDKLIISESFNKKEKKFIKEDKNLNYFKIEKTNIINNKLQIAASLEKLPDGIFRYEIICYPSRNAYQVNQWWKRWDMDPNRIGYWLKNPQSFDGSKTYNLNKFMDDLVQSTYIVHQPKIAHIYFYFNSN